MPAPKNSPDNPAPDQQLIDAARHYTHRVTGQGLQRITLTLTDGTKRKLDVPAPLALVTDWPPEEGWSVRGDRGARNGETFRLTGKPLALFSALVGAGDTGLTLLELKRAVWDEQTEERTVQNMISKLRQLIRDRLEMRDDEEPIEADGDRYRLAAA